MRLCDIVRFIKVGQMLSTGGYIMRELDIENRIKQEQINKKEKVLDDIKRVDSKFDEIVASEKGEDVNLLRLDTMDRSDEEVRNQAVEELAVERADGLEKIENEYNAKKDKVESGIEKLKLEYTNGKEDIENEKQNIVKKIENKLRKNNMLHSSIYAKLLNEAEKSELEKLNLLSSSVQEKVEKKNGELQDLSIKRQNALEIFDIAYAVKVQEKMDKIKKEINAYNDEIAKFNAEIEKKEQNFAKKHEKEYSIYLENVKSANAKIKSMVDKLGVKGVENSKNTQKFEIAKNYLNTLDRETALEILSENEDFKIALGSENYEKILNYIKERKV